MCLVMFMRVSSFVCLLLVFIIIILFFFKKMIERTDLSHVTGYGITSDGRIIFINASTCDLNYLPTNPPIVFDIALPPGVTKD
jgi:hypothetical protein